MRHLRICAHLPKIFWNSTVYSRPGPQLRRRCRGRGHAVQTALGLEPAYEDLDWSGLDYPKERFIQVMAADKAKWDTTGGTHTWRTWATAWV